MIGKKLRFEIFRRDDFSCRYCGRSAQDGAVLEPDHVVPRARGGADEATNLVTACEECNSGKSDTKISAPTIEDVPLEAFRRACKERGLAAPVVMYTHEHGADSDSFHEGRLAFAHEVISKTDEWDRHHCFHKACEAVPDDATDDEVDLRAAAIALDAVFDERDRLRDIVMGFLHALPDGMDHWKRAVAKLKAENPGPLQPIDIIEEAIFGALNGVGAADVEVGV